MLIADYFQLLVYIFQRCVNWLLTTEFLNTGFAIGYLFIVGFIFDILIFYIIPAAGAEGRSLGRFAKRD